MANESFCDMEFDESVRLRLRGRGAVRHREGCKNTIVTQDLPRLFKK